MINPGSHRSYEMNNRTETLTSSATVLVIGASGRFAGLGVPELARRDATPSVALFAALRKATWFGRREPPNRGGRSN
jgi:hypothetical protein